MPRLDIVIFPARIGQDLPDVMAEIALDFQHQRRRSDFGIPRLPGQDLLCEWVHTS